MNGVLIIADSFTYFNHEIYNFNSLNDLQNELQDRTRRVCAMYMKSHSAVHSSVHPARLKVTVTCHWVSGTWAGDQCSDRPCGFYDGLGQIFLRKFWFSLACQIRAIARY
jgi:hypothetical protein